MGRLDPALAGRLDPALAGRLDPAEDGRRATSFQLSGPAFASNLGEIGLLDDDALEGR